MQLHKDLGGDHIFDNIVLDERLEVWFAHVATNRALLRKLGSYGLYDQLPFKRVLNSIRLALSHDLKTIRELSGRTYAAYNASNIPLRITENREPDILARAMVNYNLPAKDGGNFAPDLLIKDAIANRFIQGIEQAQGVEAPLASVIQFPFWRNSA